MIFSFICVWPIVCLKKQDDPLVHDGNVLPEDVRREFSEQNFRIPGCNIGETLVQFPFKLIQPDDGMIAWKGRRFLRR
jgi:hypothetical protein